ncbi:MAG: hypothetical protein RMJ98_09430, partial [Myxococcales bacterium]|nr:hypothetical protein [Polyangiaceae bacterium]MDW8249508.1 hypothetical protein [Myxococcales bacterium]
MTTTLPPEASTLSSPEHEALTAAVARLQSELEGVENGDLRAMYLYELALMLERLQDAPSAARSFKESYNSAPGFREPLEALISILRRHGSYKNLGRLLEALTRVQGEDDSAEARALADQERARARVELAAFQMDHLGDVGAARATLLEATGDSPDELAAWLELELLAAKEGDTTLRRDALRERAIRADSPLWRALLLLDLAELTAPEDAEAAASLCREAAALEGAGRFRAQLVLARLARQNQDLLLLAESLEAQAEMIERALEDSRVGDAEGVPLHLRTAVHAADLLLRAAEARRLKGDLRGAQSLLERAQASSPGAIELGAAQLALADTSGDLTLS